MSELRKTYDRDYEARKRRKMWDMRSKRTRRLHAMEKRRAYRKMNEE